MSKTKRLWGILGSLGLVLLIGLFQSSAHATPGAIGMLPTVPMVAPASVNSISSNTVPQRAISRNSPLSKGMAFFSKPENIVNSASLAGQLLLALYGLSLVCAGREAGKAASKSTANVVWGLLFIGIAVSAPQLVGWVAGNSSTSIPETSAPNYSIRSGGCG